MVDTFYGTKKVIAASMTRAQYNKYRGWDLPKDENGADEGYLVEYMDGGKPNMKEHEGYVSWSPKEQFEKAYQSATFDSLSFSHALFALKEGKAVARSGWNGKGMYIYLVPANSYPAQTKVAIDYWSKQPNVEFKTHYGDSLAGIPDQQIPLVPYGAYLAMKTAQGNVVPWLASQTDIIADDWAVVN